MSASPVDDWLGAIDRRDLDAAMAMVSPDCRLLVVDGRRAEGSEAVRALLATYLAAVRSSAHHITAQWHQDGVWIAEVEADYELIDRLRITARPRAFVIREGTHGFADIRVYGAHEQPLTEHAAGGEKGMHLGGHLVPPL
ncbi:MAG: nuclear transport factor 2 family protein [Solirubrobacteraceae bacterium]